jgi:PAS domain S-box-containing protein
MNMKNYRISSSKISSFKIVLIYALVSAIYIYTSDYFLEKLVTNVELLSKIQTYKGLGFIVITSALLYILVKRNINTTTSYYQQIIDLKQTSDNQLKKSNDEYMSLFNHSPLPKWIFDLDTLQFLLVNDVACDNYGYTREEFLSMTIRDIRPIEDIPILEEILDNTFKKGQDERARVLRHLKKNGEIIYVKIKANFITFEERKVILVTSVDVTAEIETRNKLTEINSRLKVASEIAHLGYWTNDLVKSEIQWSDEVYKIFEVNPVTFELTLENIKNCYHQDDAFEFDSNLNFSFDGINTMETERRINTCSGETKWVLERINLIKDENGNPIKLDGIVIDITKRKLYEQEIIASNERFKIIAKATIEAIVDWDIKNDTVIWGEGFQSIFGYDLDVYDNYLWSNNIHPDDKEKVLEDLNKILEDPSQEYFNAEFRFLKANREVAYVQHKGIIIRDASGKPIRGLAALIDLTETLDRLRKIESQNKLLKEIAWTQSHVVRAPLANLQGFIKLLKDEIKEGITDDKLLDYIIDSTEKLDEIIHEIVKKINEIDKM